MFWPMYLVRGVPDNKRSHQAPAHKVTVAKKTQLQAVTVNCH